MLQVGEDFRPHLLRDAGAPGDAIAGGNEMALHCDLVVASEAARFGMSLAQVGLAPNWFLSKKLMEVLGPREINVSVWDFAIEPQSGDNANSILPIEP